MSDDKRKQGHQDDAFIDLNDSSELSYAAKAWGVSADAVITASRAIKSNSRKAIHDELRRSGKI